MNPGLGKVEIHHLHMTQTEMVKMLAKMLALVTVTPPLHIHPQLSDPPQLVNMVVKLVIVSGWELVVKTLALVKVTWLTIGMVLSLIHI